MTFAEKYPKLKDKRFLVDMLTGLVFSTMYLENQQVPKDKVRKIVKDLVNKGS